MRIWVLARQRTGRPLACGMEGSRFYSLARASFPPCSSSFTFMWMMLLYRELSRSSV